VIAIGWRESQIAMIVWLDTMTRGMMRHLLWCPPFLV